MSWLDKIKMYIINNLNWPNAHYIFAVIGTLIVFYKFIILTKADITMCGFVFSLWGTAITNDKLNTPNPNMAYMPKG